MMGGPRKNNMSVEKESRGGPWSPSVIQPPNLIMIQTKHTSCCSSCKYQLGEKKWKGKITFRSRTRKKRKKMVPWNLKIAFIINSNSVDKSKSVRWQVHDRIIDKSRGRIIDKSRGINWQIQRRLLASPWASIDKSVIGLYCKKVSQDFLAI